VTGNFIREAKVLGYVISFSVGLLVGILYSVLSVRSPAPPLIALVGLLGMLTGEQVVPTGKRLLFKNTTAAVEQTFIPHSARQPRPNGMSNEPTPQEQDQP
jgi:XapX domain-containing protein